MSESNNGELIKVIKELGEVFETKLVTNNIHLAKIQILLDANFERLESELADLNQKELVDLNQKLTRINELLEKIADSIINKENL